MSKYYKNDKDNDDIELVVELHYNILYLYGEINTKSAFKFNKIIQEENQKIKDIKNPFIDIITYKPLYVFIKSTGGFVASAYSIIDTILTSKIPIYTVIDGYAASSATLISIVGKKRYIKPNASMLIHQVNGGISGSFQAIHDYSENLEQIMEKNKELYTKYTKMNITELENRLACDKTISAKDCITLGLVDEFYKGEL